MGTIAVVVLNWNGEDWLRRFLPEVVRFNAAADTIQREQRLQRMAHAMGLARCDAQGSEISQALRDMNARLGLPSGLAALGVTESMFGRIIEGALVDHCHRTNPRVASADDYRDILARSM